MHAHARRGKACVMLVGSRTPGRCPAGVGHFFTPGNPCFRNPKSTITASTVPQTAIFRPHHPRESAHHQTIPQSNWLRSTKVKRRWKALLLGRFPRMKGSPIDRVPITNPPNPYCLLPQKPNRTNNSLSHPPPPHPVFSPPYPFV